MLACLLRKRVGLRAKIHFRLSVGLEYAVYDPDPKSRVAGSTVTVYYFLPQKQSSFLLHYRTDMMPTFFKLIVGVLLNST